MAVDSAIGSLILDVAAWLVTYALHSTVLLLAALAAFALIARAERRSPRFADAAPAWRERIGKVALIAGLATATLQSALSIEPFGLRPALLDGASPAVVARGTDTAPERSALADREPPSRSADASPAESARILPAVPMFLVPVFGLLQHASEYARPDLRPAESDARPALGAAATEDGSDSRAPWIAAFVALWALVAVAALARRLLGWRLLAMSLAGAEPVTDEDALATFDALCRRAGLRREGPRAAVLCVAPLLASPVTRGILRPEICLPPRALRDLDEDEFAALLGHEIAHAARRDPAWLVLFRALEVAFCLQPLNRVVARRLEDDAELLCDDRAVVWTGDRLPLASCLTEVASWLLPAGREPRLAVGMAAHGVRLSRRVERLVDANHRPDAGARRPALTAVAVVLAGCAVVVVPGFAAQRAARPLPLDLQLELALASEPVRSVDGSTTSAEGDPAVPGVDTDADATCAEQAPDMPLAVPAVDSAPFATASAPRPLTAPEAAPLANLLDELERDLTSLRASLRERDGGAALERDLDALAGRIAALRLRESALAALLARPAHILLSPIEAGRSAEDQ